MPVIVQDVEFNVPAEIAFPFGYSVVVRRISETRLKRECGKGTVACWDADKRTVWLLESRQEKLLFEDFAHELLHVVIDWQRWVLQLIGAVVG